MLTTLNEFPRLFIRVTTRKIRITKKWYKRWIVKSSWTSNTKSPYGSLPLVECKWLNFIHKEKIPIDHLHYTANEHRKGQHLTFECRVLIQTRLKDGWSPNRIAKEIGCAPNTVRNEIKRGTVSLYKGNILRYKATAGQDAYERNRQSCCRHYDFFEKSNFISFVEQKFFEEG